MNHITFAKFFQTKIIIKETSQYNFILLHFMALSCTEQKKIKAWQTKIIYKINEWNPNNCTDVCHIIKHITSENCPLNWIFLCVCVCVCLYGWRDCWIKGVLAGRRQQFDSMSVHRTYCKTLFSKKRDNRVKFLIFQESGLAVCFSFNADEWRKIKDFDA